MNRIIKKILIFSALSFVAYSPVSAYAYDFFVDSANNTAAEDGSETNPFSTIGEAVSAAANLSLNNPSIFIRKGTYQECTEIDEPLGLYGESKDNVIIDATGCSDGISIKDDAYIEKLTIKKGSEGIDIDSSAQATIKDVTVKEAKKIGIVIRKGSTKDSDKVVIENSTISDGGGKGIYILKRRVEIENNEIKGNKEEGIDIRAGVRGSIKNNSIEKNKESGIELILGSTKLKISGNSIKKNKASGVTNQFYKENKKVGDVTLSKNKIKDNSKYGLNCQTPSKGDPIKGYWQKSLTLLKNIFSGNNQRYSKVCNLED